MPVNAPLPLPDKLPRFASLLAWQASTIYAAGERVTNGGEVYSCTTGGTSSGGPSGHGTNIADGTARWNWAGTNGPAWTDTTAFAVGDRVTSHGSLYSCVAAGTSSTDSAAGPSGSGSRIVDGTALWAFLRSAEAVLVEPMAGQADVGAIPGTFPPAQIWNWLLWYTYRWLLWLADLPNQAMSWTNTHVFQHGISVFGASGSVAGTFAGNSNRAGIDSTGGATTGPGVIGTGGAPTSGNANGGVGVYGIGGVPHGSGSGGTGVKGDGGAGAGIGGEFKGGLTGDGLHGNGGNTSGTGVIGQGGGNSPGGSFTAGAGNADGLLATGVGTGDGVIATGGTGGNGATLTGSGTGAGVVAVGGASAPGGTFTATGGNMDGGQGTGHGSGSGLVGTGGATDGHGVTAAGGGTNGGGVIGTGAGTGIGGEFIGVSSEGVRGNSTNGAGVFGFSSNGYGGDFQGNTTKAPLHLRALGMAPSSPAEGDIYYDSGLHKLRVRGQTDWETVTST